MAAMQGSPTQVRRGDRVIDVRVAGDGPAVLLTQWFRASTVAHFGQVIPGLVARGLKIVSVDPPDFATTAFEPGSTLHDLADDLSAVIRALDLGPVHLFGSAYAGFIARCLAGDHPDLIRSVIVTAPSFGSPIFGVQPSEEANLTYLTIHTTPDFDSEERRQAIQSAVYGATSASVADVHDYEITPDLGLWLLEVSAATSVEDWWSAGCAPVLILQGVQDRIAAVENARVWAQELDGRAELVELENAGHIVLSECDAEVIRHVADFVHRLEGSSSVEPEAE